MKKQFIKELAEKIVAAALNTETLPVKTLNDYSWQDFSLVADADVTDLDTIGVEAKGTIYESGTVQLTITVRPKKTNENVLDAYKRLKAKNLVLVSIERAGDAKRAEDEKYRATGKSGGYAGNNPGASPGNGK